LVEAALSVVDMSARLVIAVGGVALIQRSVAAAGRPV